MQLLPVVEACGVVADSAVVLGAVYSSAAPQECVNIHNSDHLTMGTTGGSPQRPLTTSSPLFPRLPLFASCKSFTHKLE